MAYHMYFPQPFLDLQQELQYHQELQKLLANHNEWELRLAEIASYCGVALDDTYTPKMLEEICTLCVERLRKKRMEVIVVSSSTIVH